MVVAARTRCGYYQSRRGGHARGVLGESGAGDACPGVAPDVAQPLLVSGVWGKSGCTAWRWLRFLQKLEFANVFTSELGVTEDLFGEGSGSVLRGCGGEVSCKRGPRAPG